jgi:hypothetical protein
MAHYCMHVANHLTVNSSCRPECRMLAMDLAYTAHGAGGLVTDKTRALIHLRCTNFIVMCAECVLVSGPARGSVIRLEPLKNGSTGYELQVGWENGYRGPVRVDLETARCLTFLLTALHIATHGLLHESCHRPMLDQHVPWHLVAAVLSPHDSPRSSRFLVPGPWL